MSGLSEDLHRASRRVAEAALRERDRWFAGLAELVPQLVWTAGPDGSVEYFNQRWYAYTGSRPEQSAGHLWAQVLHPDDREATWRRWQEAVQTVEPLEAECRLRAADGSYHWFLVCGLPVEAQGRVQRWCGTCTNIDVQKRAEEALEETNRTKDEFLAMLGHELRNPLGAITSALGALNGISKPDDSTATLRDILTRQTVHLGRLLEDLGDVSGLQAGKLVLRQQPVDLRELTVQGVRALQQTGRAADHDLSLRADPAWVEGDPARLEQVLANLLDNARRHTPEDGEISLWVDSASPAVARIRVADSGPGVPPADRERIFDRLVRLDEARARDGGSSGGAGLGLSIARGIARAHGGDLRCLDDSVFELLLPTG